MVAFVVTFGFSYALYLVLTAGSGTAPWFWSSQELLLGAIVAVVVGLAARTFFSSSRPRAGLDPRRWVRAIAYVCGPFFLELARANLDVAYRIITGRIRPGIVRVPSGMSTDLGVLFLANSITLTPGTLTVGIDEDTHDLFIHMIYVPPGLEDREAIDAREIFAMFDCPRWIRRITE
ncbi:MAG: Na+/H+ antiporter subunit E [Kiritimatiellia bacterium]|jgi:multicomponent Na+:H+ antiporter subunit E|nr:Na+/H+ antiporter subunit E [Kiritimatiellia bacterium]